MAKKTIFEDERYSDFIERYHADPLRFAVEVCGFSPSKDQEDLFWAVVPPTAKVSVVSGTGTGKTTAVARIALWHMLCHPVSIYEGKVEIGSNTYIGAPKLGQVAAGVWKEAADARLSIANGDFAWVNDYYTITKTRITINGFEDQWFIAQVALAKGESVGIAGKHREAQMIIVDEAAGVPDGHFDVIDGTQTQSCNRTIMLSQGVRNAGRFYDSHHTLSADKGGSWTNLRFNSENSPFVTEAWLAERLLESGGRNSDEYQIRVLGKFAQNSSNVLLTRFEMEKIFTAGQIIADDEPYGIVVLSDVAAGEYRDDSVAWIAKVIGHGDHGPDARRAEFYEIPIASNDKSEIDLAGDLVNLTGLISNATLYVDAGGIGGTVCKLIERSGGTVQRINWGKPCFKKEYKDRFYNLRACAMVRYRDAVKQGRVSVTAKVSKRLKEKILTQGSRLPYYFSEAGGLRYVMMSKEKMREEGIKSPDLIDAQSFVFLENTDYMVHENAGSLEGRVAEALKEAAEDMFAGV